MTASAAEIRVAPAGFPLGTVVAACAGVALAALGLAAVLGEPVLLMLAAIAVTAVFLLAVLAWPDVASIAVAVLVYSNAPVVAAQFHGVPYLIAALVPALLLVPILDRLVYGRQAIVFPPTLPFVLAFLLVETLSTLVSREPSAAAIELTRVATEGVLLYLLIINAVRTIAVIRLMTVALVITGVVLGALSVVQQGAAPENAFLGFAQIEGRGFDPGLGTGLQQRASGPIGEKNFYAQMLLALIPLAAAVAGNGGRARKVAATGAALVIGLGVVLTFSRGAAVAAVILVAAAVILRVVSWRLVLGFALAVVVVLASVPSYAARLATLSGVGGALEVTEEVDPVIAQRANDVLAATAAFAEHPILGVGPGMFVTSYREYATRVAGLPGDLDYAAHNLYLEVASETGVLGFMAFGGVVITTIVWLLRARREAASDPRLVALANGFLLVIVSYLATGLFLHISYQRYLWMFLALAMAAALLIRRSVETPRREAIDR